MLAIDGVGGLIIVALWLYCVFDVLFTPDGQQRNLPKLAWVFIVLLLFDIGALLWLVAGKPWGQRRGDLGAAGASRRAKANFPEYDRPGRYVPSNPDDDEEFLAGLRRRAEEQRRRARDQGDAAESGEPGDATDG